MREISNNYMPIRLNPYINIRTQRYAYQDESLINNAKANLKEFIKNNKDQDISIMMQK